MSTYIFVDSLKRDVYKYGNSGNFVIEGSQTKGWNMIPRTELSHPSTNSRNQLYNIRVCTLTLPPIGISGTTALVNHPGVFLTLSTSTPAVNSPINQMEIIDTSGYPCNPSGACIGECSSCYTKTKDEIADLATTGDVGLLTPLIIKKYRFEESREWWSGNHNNHATFYLTLDKVQHSPSGAPMWLHYKSCVGVTTPLNFRGNNIHFKITDTCGRVIEFTKYKQGCHPNKHDMWESCEDSNPNNPLKQTYALFEITHIPVSVDSRGVQVINTI